MATATIDQGADDPGLTVDDNGPEITCEPNLFRFCRYCRYCGRDMDTSSSNERNGS